MCYIFSSAKDALSAAARVLNQPLIKEGIKNVAGCITFAFGMIEVYDIDRILRGREITTESYPDGPKWMETANKMAIVCTKISLILSAGVSRPGVFIISSLVGCVVSSHQLERVFGPNTIFAVNPWHPRHVASITAVLLSLPSIAQSTYKILARHASNDSPSTTWLTDTKIRLMNLFNTVTSRPVLHIGNYLARGLR